MTTDDLGSLPRIMDTQILSFVEQYPSYAYLTVFGVLLACGLGLPLPEDIALLAGGYMVYVADLHGTSSPRLDLMIVVGFVGVLTGDSILFFIGRKLGPRVALVWPFRLIFSPRRLARTRRFFARYGGLAAFFTRFAAGIRAPAYLLAGSMGLPVKRFLAADGLAALISVPLVVWVGWYFGSELDRARSWLTRSKYALVALIACAAIYAVIRLRRANRDEPAE